LPETTVSTVKSGDMSYIAHCSLLQGAPRRKTRLWSFQKAVPYKDQSKRQLVTCRNQPPVLAVGSLALTQLALISETGQLQVWDRRAYTNKAAQGRCKKQAEGANSCPNCSHPEPRMAHPKCNRGCASRARVCRHR